ncbi:hypothetical protein TBLA_0C06000 [Henningerozyma blattae CBS 6284]|uniref:Exocyst complex component Sec10-like alpha-helical bundle domain-containing protein n=1 Tax=Henningerozyma blattae (strain ATCC 34711 / CBS 6284 / DSM 70876 / NBRC 10599 / NRRL Y-10934 / UCD 77-7) TaxID=1071380 RepID=I2H1Z5_HENB6|nr:hypothetical protein TBLA_0C06000 [Tetrapisispora blattae CBS 6284]CCH60397.1 hypothetical protein TBLA_0C06000 [Tetrapisispora blattae CBS 6284]
MEDLLKVPEIVQNIASYLNTKDYLTFQSLNKSTHDTHLKGKYDDDYWSGKLLSMEIKRNNNEESIDPPINNPNNESNLINKLFDNGSAQSFTPMDIFDKITSFTPKTAKSKYAVFFNVFNSYCDKLINNNLGNFFPKKYQSDPLFQIKIINNIELFNNSNKNDYNYYNKTKQQLKIIRDFFINTVLKEMESLYQEKNYKKIHIFIKVLILSNEETNALEFFKTQNPYDLDDLKFNDKIWKDSTTVFKRFKHQNSSSIDLVKQFSKDNSRGYSNSINSIRSETNELEIDTIKDITINSNTDTISLGQVNDNNDSINNDKFKNNEPLGNNDNNNIITEEIKNQGDGNKGTETESKNKLDVSTLDETEFSKENKHLVALIENMKIFLNEKIDIVDTIFSDEYPILISYCENFIQFIIESLRSCLTEDDKTKNDPSTNTNNEKIPKKSRNKLLKNETESKLFTIPIIYNLLKNDLIDNLKESINAGPTFHKVLKEFIDLYMEPFILNYLKLVPNFYQEQIHKELIKFNSDIAKKQSEQNKEIYNSLKDQSIAKQNGSNSNSNSNGKNDFLSSFTNMFKLQNSSTTEKQKERQKLQVDYNLNLLNTNLQNIKSFISLDLIYKVIQETKDLIEEMSAFKDLREVTPIYKAECQEIFKILITELNINHIKPSFEKAIGLLEEYDTDKIKSIEFKIDQVETQVEPLVKFTELINIGDIILQMISIFYKNELENKKIIDKNRDFLNEVIQTKKKFETMIDDYVAEGLTIGINKLFTEMNFIFRTVQLPDDYNIRSSNDNFAINHGEIHPTKCAIKVIELLNNHCFLLNGATDKGTIDVYQQEIGDRFFNEVVKQIKRNIISTEGAIYLIADLNYYYEFIAYRLRQKNIIPLFAGLKNIGQLYIVSGKDSKELGRLISDVGKFQSIFSQEEIYEFVQRRSDWLKVKRDVEKVMYGLGVKDCCIM